MADPPAGVGDLVVAHSDGNPFLVEELLAGWVADGQLRHEHGFWETTGPLTPSVPVSLQGSIDRRLSTLGATDRLVLGAAALLGRHFDWNLLPGIAGVDGRAAADSLRAAVAEQVIAVDGDSFVFRHALTREAVLAGLLPFERRELASRAWPAVELANPGLPGPSCELAADLAEAAGEPVAAAQRLLESARHRAAQRWFGHRRGDGTPGQRAGGQEGRRGWPRTPTRSWSTCSSQRESRLTRSPSDAGSPTDSTR